VSQNVFSNEDARDWKAEGLPIKESCPVAIGITPTQRIAAFITH